MQFHVLVRARNEPFIGEFVEHYLYEGADMIHIIDDSDSLEYYKETMDNPRVDIITDLRRRKPKDNLNVVYHRIKDQVDWLLVVDADEFVTTRLEPTATIRRELETTFKNVDYIKIPWVMMANNGREHNPESQLLENFWRWDHDIKVPNTKDTVRKFRCRYAAIEVKALFRPAKFLDQCLSCHGITQPVPGAVVVDSVHVKPAILDFFYSNLRERDITDARMVCYHYRFASLAHLRSKFDGSMFHVYNKGMVSQAIASDRPECRDYTLQSKTLMRRGTS